MTSGFTTKYTGRDLILISGLDGDHAFWQTSLPELATHYQVIVYDTRGIGQTDAPAGPYSMMYWLGIWPL